MKDLNRILIQLDKAITLSNSNLSQEKALAVILFDNLIELQIYRRVSFALLIDRTTWYSGKRAFDKKDREDTIGPKGKYDRLLKTAMDGSIITLADREIIQFAHEIRNAVYHRGEEDKIKLDLAILIYYSFILSHFKDWSSPSGIHTINSTPEYSGIDFGQGVSKKFQISGTDDYFRSAFDAIMGKWRIADDLSSKAHDAIIYQVDQIETGLEFIKTDGLDINYYGALSTYSYLNDLFSEYELQGRKPKGIDKILLLSFYIRMNRDYLDDIPELELRRKEGRRLLRELGHSYKGKYPYWTDLEKVKIRAKDLKNKQPHAVIKNLIDIQNKILNIYLDVREAASNIDGYNQYLYDVATGN